MEKKNLEVFWDGKTDTILLHISEHSAEDWVEEFFATFCNPEVEKFLEEFYNWEENALDLDKEEVMSSTFIGEYLFEETEVITGSGWFVIPSSINSRKVFDFEHLKNLLEKQIELYSSLEFKAEIYRQAATKIDRIKDRFESDEDFDLEDVGGDLLCNFLIAYSETIYEKDPIIEEIGEIGADMEWGNANLEDWNRILKELKPRLTTEINSKD